jgi:hypothetical protein
MNENELTLPPPITTAQELQDLMTDGFDCHVSIIDDVENSVIRVFLPTNAEHEEFSDPTFEAMTFKYGTEEFGKANALHYAHHALNGHVFGMMYLNRLADPTLKFGVMESIAVTNLLLTSFQPQYVKDCIEKAMKRDAEEPQQP